MRIGFDVTALCAPPSGIGTYTSNLLAYLSTESNDEILPFAHRPVPPSSTVLPVTSPPLRMNKTLWMQAVLPWQLRGLRTDVCHFTNSVAPLATPCPSVITIHDMTLWLFPKHHPRRRLLAMRPLIPVAAHRAATIVAVSQAGKQDIVRILGLPENKVQVIYEAAAPHFRRLSEDEALMMVRREQRLPDRFILHVGVLEPRKNLARLLEALSRVWRAGNCRHQLVLVGRPGWHYADIFAAVERLGLNDAVRFLGYVPTKTLVALYNMAEVLVFPSLYEGFGLTVLEAMACGTPVVTSPNGSLREIAGDAADYVEPTDVDSIAAGLERVLTEPDRRQELRARGFLRAAQFSWTRAAAETRQVYTRAAAQKAEGSHQASEVSAE